MNYVVISKKADKHGRQVLMSFASTTIWKSFEEIRRQEDTIPECYNKSEAQYALNKYGGGCEIIPAEKAKKELEEYIQKYPNWQ